MADAERKRRSNAPPPDLGKRCRVMPCSGVAAPAAAVAPFDALRRVFPDADVSDLEACLAASGRDVDATVQCYRAWQARDEAVAARLARAAREPEVGGCCADDECAGIVVEHMAAAADVAESRRRASWMLAAIARGVAEREGLARLRAENAALRGQAAALARGVAATEEEVEEAGRAVAAMRRELAELEMRKYALGARLRDAGGCRFQAAHRGPDVP